jgi:hypothetical protein
LKDYAVIVDYSSESVDFSQKNPLAGKGVENTTWAPIEIKSTVRIVKIV